MTIRQYSGVPNSIWKWPSFRKAAHRQQLTCIYLWTNGHVDSSGCYYLPTGYAVTDRGCTAEEFEGDLAALVSLGLADHDPETEYVRVPGWFKFNAINGGKVAKGTLTRIEAIPCDRLRNAVMAEFEDAGGPDKIAKMEAEQKAKQANEAVSSGVNGLTARSYRSPGQRAG